MGTFNLNEYRPAGRFSTCPRCVRKSTHTAASLLVDICRVHLPPFPYAVGVGEEDRASLCGYGQS